MLLGSRGGRSPTSAGLSSLPLFPCAPPNDALSCFPEPGLTTSLTSLPPLLMLLPVGCGEIARGPRVLGFELAIRSKWERREDTGF